MSQLSLPTAPSGSQSYVAGPVLIHRHWPLRFSLSRAGLPVLQAEACWRMLANRPVRNVFTEWNLVGGEVMMISKSALLGAFAKPEYGINFWFHIFSKTTCSNQLHPATILVMNMCQMLNDFRQFLWGGRNSIATWVQIWWLHNHFESSLQVRELLMNVP